MILQLKRIFERIGEQKELDVVIPLEELRESVGGLDFIAPVSLKGRISNTAGMVSLDYSMAAEIKLICDRCLDEFTKKYDLSFSHILVADEDSLSDENDIVCDGESLDLTELCASDLLISLPTKILCKEDCRGLCPVCGKSLNTGECNCVKENE